MPDVPQTPADIITATRERAAVMARQVAALHEDLQDVAGQTDVLYADGAELLVGVAGALQQLALSTDIASGDPERGL